jgi:cytochrome c5
MLCLLFVLGACSSSSSEQSTSSADFSPAFMGQNIDVEVASKWMRSCALCHVRGEADAPVIGDTEEWQRRLAQGEESILRRVIDGYRAMPPLGYCMSCEESDFREMIAFMAGAGQ